MTNAILSQIANLNSVYIFILLGIFLSSACLIKMSNNGHALVYVYYCLPGDVYVLCLMCIKGVIFIFIFVKIEEFLSTK